MTGLNEYRGEKKGAEKPKRTHAVDDVLDYINRDWKDE
jgi:hypothetical protein